MPPDAPVSSPPLAPPGREPVSPWLRALIWAEAAVLLALGQMLWAGYQLGAGNQSIQIAFLRKLHDPSLYPRDAMVNSTLGDYPSYFYAALAWTLSYLDLSTLYLGLHVTATAGVFLAVAALCRWLFNDDRAGLIAALALLTGQLHGLAGETLYSTGLTHTWATFPLALLVLAFYGRGWVVAALALTGLIFNLHALTAGYVLAMITGASFVQSLSRPRRLEKGLIPGGLLFLVLASPTLALMLGHHQSFDATWLMLMHVRSADHSFPSAWWQAGAMDVPRFALIVALGVLAMSHPLPTRTRRLLVGVGLATGAMFTAGWLFTEVWPVPLVVRAQLFRASQLVVVLAVALSAHGFARTARTLLDTRQSKVPAVLDCIATGLALACLAIPGGLVLLPWALLLATIAALVNRRLAWWQAMASATALLITVAAWRTIHYDIPALGAWPAWSQWVGGITARPVVGLVATMVGAAAIIWLAGTSRFKIGRRIIAVVALPLCVMALVTVLPRWSTTQGDPWADVQAWAQAHTPPDALFLTPTTPGGFRIGSQRGVVVEWRDGTQLYFSAGFAPTWWQRINRVRSGAVLNGAGTVLLSQGKPLGTASDERIIELAKEYNATHVVLPVTAGSGVDRRLIQLYANAQWAVYAPRLPQPVVQADADPMAADERFLREVVQPNIEKYRKSDVRLQVLDATGRPINDARFDVEQVNHHFGFGCSLPFFAPRDSPSFGDFKPQVVKPVELERFGEIFNFSMIPFSSKWMYLEPVEGRTDYSELDQYVQWCADHRVAMEFHFLSGYLPGWLRKRPEEEQGRRFLKHAREVVDRYADRIEYFQVVNEKLLIRQSPEVFKLIRRIAPQAKLGIADCARFYAESHRPGRQDRELLRGLEEIKWLKQQGVKLDYFGFHAHRPFGLWASASDMYGALDAFAAQDVKIHITEFGMPLDKPMLGPLRQGETWTDEEQARYYHRFYTIIFSHPAVETLNLWLIGPDSWMPQSGLLDKDYQPKPAFIALRKLIKETWHTRVTGMLRLDGTASFRGFHGDYTLTLHWPDGPTATTSLSVVADQADLLRFTFDQATMRLTPADTPARPRR